MHACTPPPASLVAVVRRATAFVSSRVMPVAVPDVCLQDEVPTGSGMATPGTVWFAQSDATVFAQPVKRWPADRPLVVLHEVLHQVSMANGLAGGDQMQEEDAFTEAVSQDLRPTWLRMQIGHDVPVGLAYRDLVARARRASAIAVGRPWRSPEARAWRIKVLAMPPADRPQI